MVTHAHPCCPMPTPTVSVPCNLTALHEFYGFGFQGHLRGGGCFPSSLLGLSGVQCPSATLSLERGWSQRRGRRRTRTGMHLRKLLRRSPPARSRRLNSEPLPLLRHRLRPPRIPIGRHRLYSRVLWVEEVYFQFYWIRKPSITTLKSALFRARSRSRAQAPVFSRETRSAPLRSPARPPGSCGLRTDALVQARPPPAQAPGTLLPLSGPRFPSLSTRPL